jgi:phosphohistidine phosphatase SixA
MRTSTWLLTLLLLVSAVLPAQMAAAAETAVIYVVRHAEKDGNKGDVALTRAGEERAELLAGLLGDVPLKAVYSTDTLRTRSTGQPAARSHQLDVTLYDPQSPGATLSAITAAGGSYLVVGHSNTVGGLVEALGGAAGAEIAHSEFDRLYIVTVASGAPVSTVLLRYGTLSATAGE